MKERREDMVTAVFRDRESAERAYNDLIARGYSRDDISVIMTDDTRKKHFSGDRKSDMGNKALEGAATGGAIGGAIGATLAAIAAAASTIAIPGVGLIIAGPLAGALAGGAVGSATGGILGALVGAGIPEERAKDYERDLKEGGIVLGVNPRNPADVEYLERELHMHGARM